MVDKKVLDPDWVPKNEEKIEGQVKNLDGGENPRLIMKLNIPATQGYYDVLQHPGVPYPLAIMVMRADADVMCLGILEKMKLMICQLQVKLSTKSKLTQGVGSAAQTLQLGRP